MEILAQKKDLKLIIAELEKANIKLQEENDNLEIICKKFTKIFLQIIDAEEKLQKRSLTKAVSYWDLQSIDTFLSWFKPKKAYKQATKSINKHFKLSKKLNKR